MIGLISSPVTGALRHHGAGCHFRRLNKWTEKGFTVFAFTTVLSAGERKLTRFLTRQAASVWPVGARPLSRRRRYRTAVRYSGLKILVPAGP